jgi:hypothetical protein
MGRRYRQLEQDLEKARKAIIWGLLVVITAFVLFEALRGQHFWNKIKGEGNLWNYGSSLIYFMVGELAIVNAMLLAYRKKLDPRISHSWGVPAWTAAGLAFIFAACDEMLEVHEKVGGWLERSIPLLLAWYPGHADNLIIGVYGLGMLLFAAIFFRELSAGSRSRGYFIVGLLAMVGAVSLDVIPRALYINHLPFRETEELLEVLAGYLFTAAFISTAAVSIVGILRAYDEAGVTRDDTKA